MLTAFILAQALQIPVLNAAPFACDDSKKGRAYFGRTVGAERVCRGTSWTAPFSINALTPPFITISGTMPADPGAQAYGTSTIITSAGSASHNQNAARINLAAGYTGSTWTTALTTFNQASGTANDAATGDGNIGLWMSSDGNTASGLTIGGLSTANNTSGARVGFIASARFDPADTGRGLLAHGSSNGVGALAILRSTTVNWPTGVALAADNGDQTGKAIIRAFQAGNRRWSVETEGTIWAKVGTKTLTDATATAFVGITVSSNGRQGGVIYYCVDADDGTDFQTRCGSVSYAGVNKAGTETCGVGTPADAVAASTGTLTVSFDTDTSGPNNCLIRANATSSLTETTLRINYHVQQFGNAATLTVPQ